MPKPPVPIGLILIVLASSCVAKRLSPVTSSPPAKPSTPTPTPLPSSSPTRSPQLATPQAKPDPTRVAEAHVVDASLLHDGFGWAWKGGRRLLATVDGGASWREMTLPEIGSGFIQAAFFLDADIGWVGAGYPQEDSGVQPIAVMSTQDGGSSWQVQDLEVESSFGNPGHIIDLRFLDGQHGWMALDFTAAMNSSSGELLRSADGGRTWQPSQLPNAGPVYFNSPSIGWTIGNFNNGARRRLYRTLDGGNTWQPYSAISEPVDDSSQYNDYLLPVFFNQREGILPILLSDQDYGLTGLALYRTMDGGYTWSHASTLRVPLSSWEWGQAAVDIIDDAVWVAASDAGEVYLTVDRGRNWRLANQAEGQPHLSFWGLSFTSQAIGWGVAYEQCQGGVIACLQLYRTDDGGQRWELLRVEE